MQGEIVVLSILEPEKSCYRTKKAATTNSYISVIGKHWFLSCPPLTQWQHHAFGLVSKNYPESAEKKVESKSKITARKKMNCKTKNYASSSNGGGGSSFQALETAD